MGIRQQSGGIAGVNSLAYQGSTPNVFTYNRRPTVQDGFSWPIGTQWVVPVDTVFTEGEVWVLVSKANSINTWKKLENTVPPETKTGLVHLQTVSTNNAPVPFLALSGDYFAQYNSFVINLNNIAPDAGGNSQLNMYMSTDGGSTFLTGSDCGLTSFRLAGGTSSSLSSTVGGGCPVISNYNTAATGGGSGSFYLSFGGNIISLSRVPHFSGVSFGSDSVSSCSANFAGLMLNAGSQVNYIKFIWESVSQGILDGRISIYAYINS